MEITKMLILSTGHLTVETRNAIETDSLERTFWKSEYGWITYVTCITPSNPEDLKACMQICLDNGCNWIMFDADGDRIDSLPYYGD